MHKKLHLSKTNKKIAGVLGGLGEYFDVDATLLRVLWVIITIFSGIIPGILAYLFVWAIMPENNKSKTEYVDAQTKEDHQHS